MHTEDSPIMVDDLLLLIYTLGLHTAGLPNLVIIWTITFRPFVVPRRDDESLMAPLLVQVRPILALAPPIQALVKWTPTPESKLDFVGRHVLALPVPITVPVPVPLLEPSNKGIVGIALLLLLSVWNHKMLKSRQD